MELDNINLNYDKMNTVNGLKYLFNQHNKWENNIKNSNNINHNIHYENKFYSLKENNNNII
jgi:hypothetical protein